MIILFYLYRYNKAPEKSKEQLISELNCFLAHGYLEMDSYDEPLDEAAEALIALNSFDEQACVSFCKKILLSENFGDAYLDGFCLSFLFNIEKEYALKYSEAHIENIPAPVLDDVMDGLVQYSRTPFRKHFSKELITKIYTRYDEVSQKSYHKKIIDNAYNFFEAEFPRDNYKV